MPLDYTQVIQIIVAVMWLVLVALMMLYSIKHFSQLMKAKKYSARPLFKGFGQKMWMTAGIGILFFGLYAGLVLLGSYFMDQEVRKKIFFSAYKNPTVFIYGGLALFAFTSISIYIARILIIRFYNNRH